jgi:hypothetical protein
MLQERRLKIQIKISVQAVCAKSEENILFMLSLH